MIIKGEFRLVSGGIMMVRSEDMKMEMKITILPPNFIESQPPGN